MDMVLSVGKWLLENYQALLSGVIGVLMGLVGLFMLIPGEQPEKAIKAVADFLSKFSKK